MSGVSSSFVLSVGHPSRWPRLEVGLIPCCSHRTCFLGLQDILFHSPRKDSTGEDPGEPSLLFQIG